MDAGAKQPANGVFIFDASSITFNNASTLTLSGLPNNTAYVQYPPTVNAGTFAKVRGSAAPCSNKAENNLSSRCSWQNAGLDRLIEIAFMNFYICNN